MRLFDGSNDRLIGTAPNYDGNGFIMGFVVSYIGSGPKIGGVFYDDVRLKVTVLNDTRVEIRIKRSTADYVWTSAGGIDNLRVFLMQWTGGSLTVWRDLGTTDMVVQSGTAAEGSGTVGVTGSQAHIGEAIDGSNRYYGRIGQMWIAADQVLSDTQRYRWGAYLNLPNIDIRLHLPMFRPLDENEQDAVRTDPASTDSADRLPFVSYQVGATVNSSPVTRYFAAGGSGSGASSSAPSGSLTNLVGASAAGDLIEIDGSQGSVPDISIATGLMSGPAYARRQHVTIYAKAGTNLVFSGGLTIDLPWIKIAGTSDNPIQVTGNLALNSRAMHIALEYVNITRGELRITGTSHLRVTNCSFAYQKYIVAGDPYDNTGANDGCYIGTNNTYNTPVDIVFDHVDFGPIKLDPASSGHVDAMQTGAGRHVVFRWCRFSYGASQTLQLGNEGGPLDGILFDHCLILNPGADAGSDVGQINLVNINTSGSNGLHRNISFIHCTMGPGPGPALSGALDISTRGGSGFASSACRIENCVINRITVGSTLVSYNVAGTGGLAANDGRIGTGNRVGTLQLTGDTQVRPWTNSKPVAGTLGAGYRSTTIGTKVRDGLGVAYAIVSNIDLGGNTHQAAAGWGAFAESDWNNYSNAEIYKWDGIVFQPYGLWAYKGQGQDWQEHQLAKTRD